MVSTRKSAANEDDQPYASTRQRQEGTGRSGINDRELRQLLIDGNESLRGGRRKKEETGKSPETYNWRGASYVVDQNTPDEYRNAQPRRYKSSYTHGSQDRSSSLPQSRSSARVSTLGKRKRDTIPSSSSRSERRHRRRFSTASAEEGAEDEETRPKSRSKRHRSAQEIAEENGLQTQPVSWADKITSEIAVGLVKFLAIQKQLRKYQQEYKLACDLRDRIAKHGDQVGSDDAGSKTNGYHPSAVEDGPEEYVNEETHDSSEFFNHLSGCKHHNLTSQIIDAKTNSLQGEMNERSNDQNMKQDNSATVVNSSPPSSKKKGYHRTKEQIEMQGRWRLDKNIRPGQHAEDDILGIRLAQNKKRSTIISQQEEDEAIGQWQRVRDSQYSYPPPHHNALDPSRGGYFQQLVNKYDGSLNTALRDGSIKYAIDDGSLAAAMEDGFMTEAMRCGAIGQYDYVELMTLLDDA